MHSFDDAKIVRKCSFSSVRGLIAPKLLTFKNQGIAYVHDLLLTGKMRSGGGGGRVEVERRDSSSQRCPVLQAAIRRSKCGINSFF